jgi:hypothetical protein
MLLIRIVGLGEAVELPAGLVALLLDCPTSNLVTKPIEYVKLGIEITLLS